MARQKSFSKWLQGEMIAKNLSVKELADASSLTGQTIRNILSGRISNPQQLTQDNVKFALNSMKNVVNSVEEDVAIPPQEAPHVVDGISDIVEFFPHEPEDCPEVNGIYIFYDNANRPIYIGKAAQQTIKQRISQHREKWWFRREFIKTGRYSQVIGPELCDQLERVIIKALGAHNFLNISNTKEFRADRLDKES